MSGVVKNQPTSNAALQVVEVSKSYGKHPVLKNLNLTVDEGEFVVLLGPSGCGKTTLLRIIAGLVPLDSGTVMLKGKDITGVPPHKRDIGLVFQNYALFPHMNVFKNLAFGLRMRSLAKPAIEQRVADALRILEMEGMQKRKVTELSGGQQQRVALARALVLQPSLLLLDEPLSNLDAKLRAVVRVEIVRLQKQLQITSILVTHDQVEAMTMGDRVVLIKDGVVQQIGSPLAIYEQPANLFVAGFIGSPSINLFPIEISGGRVVFAGHGIDLPVETARSCLPVESRLDALAAGEKYILGVRPEDVEVFEHPDSERAMFDAEVAFVEILGSDTFLHLQLADKTIIARAPKHIAGIKTGDRAGVAFRPNSGHLFEAQTEERVSSFQAVNRVVMET
jgi:multiple sugar transport system ATP-binding protein